MATIKEIRTRINSVSNTLKITDTMYLVSSAKFNSAAAQLNEFREFYQAVDLYSSMILSGIDKSASIYTDDRREGINAYLILGSDKGLSGDYNKQLAKKAKEIFSQDPNCKIYASGNKLKSLLMNLNVPTARKFEFSLRAPDDESAEFITVFFTKLYDDGKIATFNIVYTEHINGVNEKIKCERVLPITPKGPEKQVVGEFVNTRTEIIDTMMSLYLKTIIRAALFNSFCSEQSARMLAMQSASDNAKELLGELKAQYNHTRQAAITREITEISGERNQS